MSERLEDEDREALATLTDAPPTRKSYSQQLRTNTGTQIKRHQLRKNSLDEDRIPKRIESYYDSSDEDYYTYATGGGVDCNVSGSGNDWNEYNHISQRIDQFSVSDGSEEQRLQPLPEFCGSGGGVGIFKVPSRSAVHPGRPPCVELRPHPLRETQVGKFIRTIACTDTQLWAGLECGVRVWKIADAYEAGIGIGGRARRGDEDAAPFYESGQTSPTMCLWIDQATKLVWSGHKDGKIRSFRIDQTLDDNPFKEGLSWQAHRSPILSMAVSSYGDIWSGTEGGVIKVWPWESVEKSLSLSPEERHMAALLVERSSVDLKSQVTVNGVCSISSLDVKCLISDPVKSKMWAANTLSFSLWDARTRELLKVYSMEGQVDNKIDSTPSPQDQTIEDEPNQKVGKSKKEKSQGGFLQRSRNAIIGAANSVRRAATKSTGGSTEEAKRTESLVLASDGSVWSGHSGGLLIQWDGNGNKLQEFNHHPHAVLCFCTYGSKIWIGYVSGYVQVMDLEGNLIASWVAHNGPVLKLGIGKGKMFSLATHGGIRGWFISSPGPVDDIVRPKLAEKENMYTRMETVRILVGTWNVSQGKPAQEALVSWLGSAVSDVGILVVGLQEIEMGAGFLAMSAAKETVGLEGSSIGQWWQDAIGKVLDEGTTFERVGSRQLAPLLIAIWVRKSIRTYVGDLDVGAVPCGLGRAIGNKGGVGLRLRVYDRIMCFVNCHFAAHLEAVNRRNADFNHIYRTMSFIRSPNSNLVNNASAGVSTAAQLRGANAAGEKNAEEGKPDLAEADMIIFCGDFNYRLFGISYDEARDFVSQRSFDWLREKDQLRAEMKAGKVFQGMREALVRFPPTYKFERGKPGLGGYDSGEKKRIPAWCDRILYRDNRPGPTSECSLECPVVCSILQYEACMDVIESDHKPVRCKFNVEISHVDRSARRQEFGKIIRSDSNIKSIFQELSCVPETVVSTDRIVLQNQESSTLRISNKSGKDKAVFLIICEGQSTGKEDEKPLEYRPRSSFGFPRWLEVLPAAGLIKPDQSTEVSINHVESHTLEDLVEGVQQSWTEEARDKEVILSIIVTGSCSIGTKTHKVYVRHCFSSKTVNIDSKAQSPKKQQGGSGGGAAGGGGGGGGGSGGGGVGGNSSSGSSHRRSNATLRHSSGSFDMSNDHPSHGS